MHILYHTHTHTHTHTKIERSLQDYEDTVTLVNHVVTTSYILIKYVVGPVLWLVLERADKRRRGRRRRQKKCGCLSLGMLAD